MAVETLEQVYPQAVCALQYAKPYELLIAVRLSAQCTDARVNQVMPTLFATYSSLEQFAATNLSDLEEIVRPCGFYHTKAKKYQGYGVPDLRKFWWRCSEYHGGSFIPSWCWLQDG